MSKLESINNENQSELPKLMIKDALSKLDLVKNTLHPLIESNYHLKLLDLLSQAPLLHDFIMVDKSISRSKLTKFFSTETSTGQFMRRSFGFCK
jgi:hypothetical protein